MDLFQAKISWIGMRKRENKNYLSVPFLPDATQKIPKKSKKIKKYNYGFISGQNRLENDEKERKQKLSFCSVPTRRVIENSKTIAKKTRKTNKYHYGFISSQNKFEKDEKERK